MHRPVWFGPLPGHPGTSAVVEMQRARIWLLEAGARERSLFLDIPAETTPGELTGLTSVAFHPDFARNGRYFRDLPGARPEIWALGFREPWRFRFDPPTGDLRVGDVGQDLCEPEVAPKTLTLSVHHDDDAEIYLNGVLAARLPGFSSDYDEVAISDEARAKIRTGPNVLAVHCHQTGGGQYIDVGISETRPRPPLATSAGGR